MARYTVKKGDNPVDIAKRYGISYDSLLAANLGVKSITPGISLRVPTNLEGAPPGVSPTDRPYIPQPYIPAPRYKPPVYKPPAPYVPPPPASGDYGPKGYPKKPGTQLPYTSPPPPYVPPPPRPTPTPPPVGDFFRDVYRQGLGRTLVQPLPDRPVVEYTGAGREPIQPVPRADLSRYNALRRAQQATQLDPNRFFRDVAKPTRVQGFLDRLFRSDRAEPVREFFRNVYDEGLGRTAVGTVEGLIPPAQAGLEPSRAGGVPSPTTFSQLVEQGYTPEQARAATIQARTAALQSGLDIEQGVMGPGGFPLFEGQEDQYPGYPAERSSIIEWYLEQGRLPVILFREDIARLGWTDAELLAAGYIKDDYGDWIQGSMEPTGVERADAGGGGGAGGYYYPGRGGGRGGGYGGGGYAYPSYLPRANQPYPQSFVERNQRGVTPTGRSMRSARMGPITWRI